MRIIGGYLKGKKILNPIDKSTRPLKDMVRESIFNIISHSNLLNSKFDQSIILDLFSGVGSFGLQIAKSIGCNVIATGGSTAKCKQASDLGADISLNHYEDDILGAVNDYTNGSGVDVVFEHSGASTWDVSMKILGKYGRVVTCGATTGPKVSIDLRYIFFKQQSIIGSTMGNVQALDAVIELVKTYKIKPIVDKIFSMEKIADAHKYLENSNQFGKVVLIP